MEDIIFHYDNLIDENNDPVHDPEPLRKYMDKWDGEQFVKEMFLDKSKSVLEIGVGTGRIAIKVAPLCNRFFGIDISPKTILKAEQNLSDYTNTKLICGDFLSHDFVYKFDVVYSSLTFMHIEDKQAAINKVASLLNDNGIFVLSIDKNQSDCIDMGTRKIRIYPDSPLVIKKNIVNAGLTLVREFETEFAYITVSKSGG